MKSRIMILLAALLLLSGCGGGQNNAKKEKMHVVATIFPEYDWTRQILGELDAEVSMLLDNGSDLHSYQPTAEDMIKISSCDLFIYVGGESDQWVDDALRNTANPNRKIINLMEILGENIKEEEFIEGMQEESEAHEEEETEYDEHVWLSLKNASICCTAIAEALCEIEPSWRETIMKNNDAYITVLSELDARYKSAVHDASFDTVLFADRFPFRYLVDDYGLRYYAAFEGCSAETEASFETVIFLAKKVDELQLPAVLTIENNDGKIARTVVENTEAKSAEILIMDSLQSTTSKEIEAGASYLKSMESNLNILTQALN